MEPGDWVHDVNLTLFGDYSAPTDSAQPSAGAGRVIAFLTGQPVTLDDELARMVRAEFAAQERYRQALESKLAALRASMTSRAAAISAELESPYTRAGEYAAGFRAGRYVESTECAQAVQSVLNELAEEVGT